MDPEIDPDTAARLDTELARATVPDRIDDHRPAPEIDAPIRALAGPAPATSPEERTRDDIAAAYAGVTAADLLLQGEAATTQDEVAEVSLIAAVCLPLVDQLQPIGLPDGRTVHSLNAHLGAWRHTPGGLRHLPRKATR